MLFAQSYFYVQHNTIVMKKTARIIFLILGIGLLVGGITAYYLWNKPQRTVDDEKGIVISADSLIATYNANEKAADAKYLNKAIQVRGTVAKVDRNQDGQATVLFESADPMSSVFCTMRDKSAKVDSGSVVTLKGFCSGHTTDVLLTDCIVVK
jgi:hypothetical protein